MFYIGCGGPIVKVLINMFWVSFWVLFLEHNKIIEKYPIKIRITAIERYFDRFQIFFLYLYIVMRENKNICNAGRHKVERSCHR